MRGFQGLRAAYLVGGGDAHTVKPSFNGQPSIEAQPNEIEGQPNEVTHFAWPGIVPNPCNDLHGGGVTEVQLVDEGLDVGGVRGFFCILIPSFGSVSEERCIAHGGGLLTNAIPWSPRVGLR